MIKNSEHTSLSQALVGQPFCEMPEHVDLRLWLALTLLPDAKTIARQREVSSRKKRQKRAIELIAPQAARHAGLSARNS